MNRVAALVLFLLLVGAGPALAQVVPYQPNDEAKRVTAVSASPSFVVFDSEGEILVHAVVAFNINLIQTSVNVLDFSDGIPRVLKSMDFARIQAGGLLFQAELSYGPDASSYDIDTSPSGSNGTLQEVLLRVSAAYAGSPLRAISDELAVRIGPEPMEAPFDPEKVVEVGTGSFQIDQIVVNFFDHVTETQVQELAAALGAQLGDEGVGIVGFEPVLNLYVLQLDLSPDDPGALQALQDAIDWLLAHTDLVEGAFRNYLVSADVIAVQSSAAVPSISSGGLAVLAGLVMGIVGWARPGRFSASRRPGGRRSGS